jgi:hypothetical protein
MPVLMKKKTNVIPGQFPAAGYSDEVRFNEEWGWSFTSIYIASLGKSLSDRIICICD